jgi:hypothetical protein
MATAKEILFLLFIQLWMSFSAGDPQCVEFSTQRRSIMRILLADYDKATFPSNNTIDVQAEVRNILFFSFAPISGEANGNKNSPKIFL